MLSLGSFRAGRPDAFIHLTVPEPARFVQRNLSGGRLHGHLRLVNKYSKFSCKLALGDRFVRFINPTVRGIAVHLKRAAASRTQDFEALWPVRGELHLR